MSQGVLGVAGVLSPAAWQHLGAKADCRPTADLLRGRSSRWDRRRQQIILTLSGGLSLKELV